MTLDNSVFEHFKAVSENSDLVSKNLYGIIFVDISSGDVISKTISSEDFDEYHIFSKESSDEDNDLTKNIVLKIQELHESDEHNGYDGWPCVTL